MTNDEPKSPLVAGLGSLKDVFDEMMLDLYRRADELPEEDQLAVACKVVKAISEHAREGGTFRYLIYDRLGFDPGAYAPLQLAGALEISNEYVLTSQADYVNEELLQLKAVANEAPFEQVPGFNRADGTPIEMPSAARTTLFNAAFKMEDLLREIEQLRAANRRLGHQVEYFERERDRIPMTSPDSPVTPKDE